MAFEGHLKGIEELHADEDEFERAARVDIFNPKGNDDFVLFKGAVQLALDVHALVGVGGKDEHHDTAGVDSLDDGVVPGSAAGNIAGRDPAANPVPLESLADKIRSVTVKRRVTDEGDRFLWHGCGGPGL
jgi:hypothetical protein